MRSETGSDGLGGGGGAWTTAAAAGAAFGAVAGRSFVLAQPAAIVPASTATHNSLSVRIQWLRIRTLNP